MIVYNDAFFFKENGWLCLFRLILYLFNVLLHELFLFCDLGTGNSSYSSNNTAAQHVLSKWIRDDFSMWGLSGYNAFDHGPYYVPYMGSATLIARSRPAPVDCENDKAHVIATKG